MLKNNKGITLIALVITIIVLLILAGVSIAMLTGQNGILNQATNAKNNTAEAEAADKINMALNAELTNLLADGYMSGMDSKTDTISTAADIASANGIAEEDFTISPGTLTGATVLTIASKKYPTVTGKITYASDTGYSIEKAKYPGETTTNET